MNAQDELIAELRNRFEVRVGWLLGVDGEQQVGKTTFAKRLADELGATTLSCDDFIRQGRLPYPHALGMEELSAALEDLRSVQKPVIVESVMLQLILEALGQKPDAVVYVRHVALDGRLTHARLFDAGLLRGAIEEDRAFDEQFFPGRKTPSLVTEILAYHEARRPHESADYVLNNCFANGS